MSAAVAPVSYAMKLYYDGESRSWGFSGRCLGMAISGSADTLRDAQKESLAALAFAFDSLREDGLLPDDPEERPATAAS